VRSANGEERPRFLTDEGFNMAVTTGLRRHYPVMDIITMQEAGLLHAEDPDLLRAAQRLDRIMLSHDTHTMKDHFYTVLAQQPADAHLPGVLLIAQETPIGKAIEWVAEVWIASQHEEWRNKVVFLPV
jgi:hypothetical protein